MLCDVKGGARLPISCLNLCSFSLALFEFLCPSATCCTSSLISFSSCSRCSAYFLISSAVYKKNSTSMHNSKYIPEQLRGARAVKMFGPHTWMTNLFFCQLSRLPVALHDAGAGSHRFLMTYASLQVSAVNLGQLLLEVLLTHILLPLQVRWKLLASFH